MDTELPYPSMALAAYLEPFLEGRRVIVFGDATSGLAGHLLDRGARLVHVYDAELSRVAEATARSASQDVTYAPLGQSGVPVRDGAFDLGVIENLSLAANGKDLVRRLRRALSARGIAMIASPNPDAKAPLLPSASGELPSYYELYDRVAEEFDEVRMLGQTPFVGYAIADFSADAGDSIALDTAFVPGGAEEPDLYVALASHFELENEPFSVVQLPLAGLRGFAQAPAPPPEPAEDWPAKLGQLEQALQAAEARAKEAQDAQQQLEQALQAAEAKASGAQDARQQTADDLRRIAELEAEVAQRDAWLKQLEERASTADERADQAEAALETERTRRKRRDTELNGKADAQALRAQLADLKEQLEHANTQLQKTDERLARTEEKREKLKEKLHALREKQAGRKQLTEDLARDVATLEQQLLERGREIQQLERALHLSARTAAQLVEELESLKQPQEQAPIVAELNSKLELLAEADARKVADLAAAQWTIQQLEARLSQDQQH